jgi:hypothetical protein
MPVAGRLFGLLHAITAKGAPPIMGRAPFLLPALFLSYRGCASERPKVGPVAQWLELAAHNG